MILVVGKQQVWYCRLDRKLVHGWIHLGQNPPVEEQTASASDSLYAEVSLGVNYRFESLAALLAALIQAALFWRSGGCLGQY